MNLYSRIAEHCRNTYALSMQRATQHSTKDYWYKRITVTHSTKDDKKFLYVHLRGELMDIRSVELYCFTHPLAELNLTKEDIAELTSQKSSRRVKQDKKKLRASGAVDSRDSLETKNMLMETVNPLMPVRLYVCGKHVADDDTDDSQYIGGWAYTMIDHKGVITTNSGGEYGKNINEMTLEAIIRALGALKHPTLVKVYTDSKYVQQSAVGRLHVWQRDGWKHVSAGRKKKRNIEYWKRVWEFVWKHNVSFDLLTDFDDDYYNQTKKMVEAEIDKLRFNERRVA